MKKSKLYTKGGDKGMTSLVGGQRVSKASQRIESYGTIDELNSFIGLLIDALDDAESLRLLTFIQHKLFSVGAYLATDNSAPMDFEMPSGVTRETIKKVEEEIDRLDSSLPEMKAFVLPAGGRAASLAHVCRAISRRAERRIYSLVESGAEVEMTVLAFVNRLSDYFFVLARVEARRHCGEEIIWDQTCN